jgi:hypothetical protein
MVLALKIEYVVFIVFGVVFVVFVGCACISKMRGRKKIIGINYV